jgi:hypothetical protein
MSVEAWQHSKQVSWSHLWKQKWEEHHENSSLGYGAYGYSHAQEDHNAGGLELYCVHRDAQRQVAK